MRTLGIMILILSGVGILPLILICAMIDLNSQENRINQLEHQQHNNTGNLYDEF